MLPDEPQPVDEKRILTMQYIALAMMFVLFFGIGIPLILLFDGEIFRITRITLPIANLPFLFIGLSSIKHKVCIFRPKGSKQHSTGKEAVTIGIILLVAYLMSIIFMFLF